MGDIISILDIKRRKNEEKSSLNEKKLDEEQDSSYFDHVAEVNKAKAEKTRKEREKTNKSVLRSYGLKT